MNLVLGQRVRFYVQPLRSAQLQSSAQQCEAAARTFSSQTATISEYCFVKRRKLSCACVLNKRQRLRLAMDNIAPLPVVCASCHRAPAATRDPASTLRAP